METLTDYRCADCGGYLWTAPQLVEPIADPNAIQLETVVLVCPRCDRPLPTRPDPALPERTD